MHQMVCGNDPESKGELVEILFCLAFAGSDLAECIGKPGDNGHQRVCGQQFNNLFNSLKLVLLTEIYRDPCLGFIDNAAFVMLGVHGRVLFPAWRSLS
jgi:hypothetical protein